MEQTNTLLSMIQGVDLGDTKAAIMAAGAMCLGLVLAIMGINKIRGMLSKG